MEQFSNSKGTEMPFSRFTRHRKVALRFQQARNIQRFQCPASPHNRPQLSAGEDFKHQVNLIRPFLGLIWLFGEGTGFGVVQAPMPPSTAARCGPVPLSPPAAAGQRRAPRPSCPPAGLPGDPPSSPRSTAGGYTSPHNDD